MAAERTAYVLKMYPRFSETFVVSEIIARERRGADIRIYSMRPPADPHFHGALALVEAPVAYIPRVRDRISVWEVLRRAADLPGFARAIRELIAADVDDALQAVDVAHRALADEVTRFHAHFASMATTIARLASLLSGIPYSFTAHAKDLFHASVDPEDVDRKIADARAVVTVSDYNLRHIRQRYESAASTPVHRVYNGLDLDVFRFRPASERGETAPVVVSVGRLVEKKGFPVLIDAIARLRADGREVRCRIVGGGGLEDELRERIRAQGVADLVELTGPVPQERIRDIVQSATVFAAPCVVGADGNADGLPTVLLEAMALGTPCVSTDVTGITEAVRDGETGRIVPQHDAGALADAIAGLIDDPETATRLARSARALVERDFDSAGQAAQLERVACGTAKETTV